MRQGLAYIADLYSGCPVCCAEVGVARGENAADFLPHFAVRKCYLVDHWKPSRWPNEYPEITQEIWDQWYQEVVELFKEYPDQIQIMRMDSEDASHLIEDGSLDFVYIDASHHYEDAFKDIQTWHPKVKKNGWVLGDDYQCAGVARAVDEAVQKLAVDLKVNEDGGTQWWYQKS